MSITAADAVRIARENIPPEVTDPDFGDAHLVEADEGVWVVTLFPKHTVVRGAEVEVRVLIEDGSVVSVTRRD